VTVTEQPELKRLLRLRGIKYKLVCNAIDKRIGWLTARLNGYIPMTELDEALIRHGIDKASTGLGLSWEAVDDG
jgi:hypothetical protein